MTAMPHATRAVDWMADASALQPQLEARLTEHFGHSCIIETLDRQLCPYTSSFRIDELKVLLHDGSRVDLVLKDMGRDTMVEAARQGRPDFLYAPLREIDAYRFVLPHAPAGAPMSYGAVTDVAAGRYWLFLERIDGVQLPQIGEFQTWERAAAWIARLHASFSPLRARQVADRVGALVYDDAFYMRWLRRAQQFVHGTPEARRIMDDVARHYGAVVDRLTKLTPTLVHGELYACNVLVARDRTRERICPVDWEMVALGPGLVDLAALSAGWAEAKQRALARAYLSASRSGNGAGAASRLPRRFSVDLDCCRLYLAVRMLGWSDTWEPPPDHDLNWLVEAARALHRLQR